MPKWIQVSLWISAFFLSLYSSHNLCVSAFNMKITLRWRSFHRWRSNRNRNAANHSPNKLCLHFKQLSFVDRLKISVRDVWLQFTMFAEQKWKWDPFYECGWMRTIVWICVYIVYACERMSTNSFNHFQYSRVYIHTVCYL